MSKYKFSAILTMDDLEKFIRVAKKHGTVELVFDIDAKVEIK